MISNTPSKLAQVLQLLTSIEEREAGYPEYLAVFFSLTTQITG
jgi:hypothetical protein